MVVYYISKLRKQLQILKEYYNIMSCKYHVLYSATSFLLHGMVCVQHKPQRFRMNAWALSA